MKLPKLSKPLPDGRKCRTCPYYLGQIRCVVSPCRACIASGRKTHPFEYFTAEIYSGKEH